MSTITMNVSGMRCDSCEALVKEALEELGGVESVEVFRGSGTAMVVYDENSVSPEALKAAIEKQGYTVSG